MSNGTLLILMTNYTMDTFELPRCDGSGNFLQTIHAQTAGPGGSPYEDSSESTTVALILNRATMEVGADDAKDM
ncbi:hypothetical protein M8C21_028827 [Ambrosia artemisiifolia]|uniref:Uncharacterized protein n=1 Tax=Ambrosia artemisiifolia TaxID=4212 RepID=A0AAD5GDC6_AMBAR|nr:hypothetical protein M8C21_028827 [Ambrosia artemisiifolia]